MLLEGGQGSCTSMRPRDDVTDKCARVRGREISWDIGSREFAGYTTMATGSSTDSRTFCSEDPSNYVHPLSFKILRTARSSYQPYLHKLSFTGQKLIYHPLYSSIMYRLPPELLREIFDYIDDDQVTLKAL